MAGSTLIHANAKENPDLFWALKGGGTNFGIEESPTLGGQRLMFLGIVTKIQMITVPNKVWAEARLYSPAQNNQLYEALMLYHEISEKDNKCTLILCSASQATLLVSFYCVSVENPEAFKPFYDLPFTARLLEPKICTVNDIVQGLAIFLTAEICL